MDTSSLKLFLEVAQQGSFAAVARAHNLDPSAVSKTIAQLEKSYDIRLFQRSTRKMVLSDAGHALVHKITPLLDALDHAFDEARATVTKPSGKLRMTMSVTFGHVYFIPLIQAFRSRYPEIQLECILTDERLDLIQHRIDLAIRLGAITTGDLVTTQLMQTQYRVVASPDYLANHAPIHAPSDLTQHDCLLFPEHVMPRAWHFQHKAQHTQAHTDHYTVPIQGRVTLSTGEGLHNLAILGAGPTLLPNWALCHAIEHGLLIDLFPDYNVSATRFDSAVWLVYPSKTYLPRKVRVMIDFLKDTLSANH